jgi:hypothetical protein
MNELARGAGMSVCDAVNGLHLIRGMHCFDAGMTTTMGYVLLVSLLALSGRFLFVRAA